MEVTLLILISEYQIMTTGQSPLSRMTMLRFSIELMCNKSGTVFSMLEKLLILPIYKMYTLNPSMCAGFVVYKLHQHMT